MAPPSGVGESTYIPQPKTVSGIETLGRHR
jgi:hypothetical protein